MGRITLEQVQTGERFIKIPMVFLEANYYSSLGTDAKFLYGILYNRFQLSLKNGWVDEYNCVYLIYTVDELGKILKCGKNKVIKLKKELIKFGLLEEVRQGLNKPNLLYLQNVETNVSILSSEFDDVKNDSRPAEIKEVSKSNFRKFKKQTSKGLKIKPQEVSKSNSNKTNNNKTNNNKTNNNKTDNNKTEIIQEDDEDIKTQNSQEKNNEPALSRKVENVTRYDKDYIWQLVYDQLLKENLTHKNTEVLMIQFDQRYHYALENMKYIHSSEQLAEYVFNGLLAEWNLKLRKLHERIAE